MTGRLVSLLAPLLMGLCTASGLQGQDDPGLAFEVHEHTLENGLRLLILPRPGAPIVSFVVQYRIGSVNEQPGQTGIAHLLEHLFFKGTTSIGTTNPAAEVPLHAAMDFLQDSLLATEARIGAGADSASLQALREQIRTLEEQASAFVVSNQLDAILSENGARSLNAMTSEEATTYFVELPANRAELWFALEGDRMANPVFREFYAERDVVAEERRLRLETNPGGLLYEAHMASAFQLHPYGKPVVGLMADVQRLTRQGVEDYFRRYYGPGNAVVAIVGDVEPSRILRWARRYLASIPPGEPPPPVSVQEPEQSRERRVEVALDAEPILRVGWRVPASTHEDAPALAMLTSILTGGRTSRLHRRLVLGDRIASGVAASPGPGQMYPGLFSIEAYPRSPHTTAELEEAIYEEMEKLKVAPPEESELQRIRNQMEATEVRRFRSNLGLALQIAESASLFGRWDDAFRFHERTRTVTPQDIQRVVRTYFREDTRTVATLVKHRASSPEGSGRKGP